MPGDRVQAGRDANAASVNIHVLPASSPQLADDVFARKLREARQAAGVTQQQVADLMTQAGYRFHRSAVAKIELGERPVTIGEAVQFAVILGMPLTELVTDHDSLTEAEHERAARVDAQIAVTSLQREIAERRKLLEEQQVLYDNTCDRLEAAQHLLRQLGGELPWNTRGLPPGTSGEADMATAMRTGFVVPDTNVLLSLYRYQAGARDEVFGALEKLQDRLWVPYQVGLEFHRHRLDVMAEQEGYFAKTRHEIAAAANSIDGKVRAFCARVGLDPHRAKGITDSIFELKTRINDEILKAQELNANGLDGHAADPILARIDTLLDNRVGAPMPKEELQAARAEAERRIREKIPPGDKDDKDKDDPAGDYLIWRELITEANERKVPAILITDDVKEDWYQRYKGRILGPRRELREEMMANAGVPLLIMTTGTFLRGAAQHLNVDISQGTVDQTREVPELEET